jgi:hypothetical protein
VIYQPEKTDDDTTAHFIYRLLFSDQTLIEFPIQVDPLSTTLIPQSTPHPKPLDDTGISAMQQLSVKSAGYTTLSGRYQFDG